MITSTNDPDSGAVTLTSDGHGGSHGAITITQHSLPGVARMLADACNDPDAARWVARRWLDAADRAEEGDRATVRASLKAKARKFLEEDRP